MLLDFDRLGGLRFVLAGIALIVGLFLLLPIALIVALSFGSSQWLQFPPPAWTLKWYGQLFANPDWESLYTLAGIADTAYEGKEAYGAYMEEKVGTDTLTLMETSAGLSGDRKYVIRHGSEKIATFTMTGTEDPSTHITAWALGKVELFFTRDHSVTVEKTPEQTVYINGVALDDSHTVKTIATRAEDYLPEGIHGYRREQQSLNSLLIAPTVTVKNADGTEVPVTVDENGIYTTPASQMVISAEEENIAINAAKAATVISIVRGLNHRGLVFFSIPASYPAPPAGSHWRAPVSRQSATMPT
jgi:hypothetical protein